MNASPELIDLAYQVRKRTLEDATDHESQNELKLLQQTIAILSDQQQRARYDHSLDSTTSDNGSAIHDRNDGVEKNDYSATIKWLVLAAIAIACFLAYQHFNKENKKTGAGVRETSTQEENPKLPLDVPHGRGAPAAGQTAAPARRQAAEQQPRIPAQAYDIRSALAGSWIWKSDKITFGRDGRGMYYRGDAVCFEFSYTLKGDVLTETADNPHGCGIGLAASFHISIADSNLTKTNIGTGYESQWQKSPE